MQVALAVLFPFEGTGGGVPTPPIYYPPTVWPPQPPGGGGGVPTPPIYYPPAGGVPTPPIYYPPYPPPPPPRRIPVSLRSRAFRLLRAARPPLSGLDLASRHPRSTTHHTPASPR